jgi:hypothetical protein
MLNFMAGYRCNAWSDKEHGKRGLTADHGITIPPFTFSVCPVT